MEIVYSTQHIATLSETPDLCSGLQPERDRVYRVRLYGSRALRKSFLRSYESTLMILHPNLNEDDTFDSKFAGNRLLSP